MTGTVDKVRLWWNVPVDLVEQFEQHVHDEYEDVTGVIGREARNAMREYADLDGGAAVEDALNDDLRDAGLRPREVGERKNSLSTDTDQPTKEVTWSVPPRTKERFKIYVDEHDDESSYGEALARALSEYLDGGRAARMKRKQERLREVYDGFLQEVNPDADGGVGTTEKREAKIVEMLAPEPGEDPTFTRAELEDAIAAVAGKSKPTIREYVENVPARMDYVEVPEGDVFAPQEDVQEQTGKPDICLRDPTDLTTEEKRERIRVELGAYAMGTGPKNDMENFATTEDVAERVFNGKLSEDEVWHHFQAINFVPADESTDGSGYKGFESQKTPGGKRILKCDMELVQVLANCDDPPEKFVELNNAVVPYAEAGGFTLSASSGPNASLPDYGGQKQAATDGGRVDNE